jgi:cyclopropane fatty-acyl-phospholipid synthase-like methyltransferase
MGLTERQLTRMQEAWDRRARENARHYIATLQSEWTDEEFFSSGEATIDHHIRSDLQNICRGKNPADMRVLEIGCGAGRITRALANFFGEVHAVDISGEMIARASEALRAHPNAHVYQNNGMDLSVVPPLPFDFAFSLFVFQHIPSYEIIESYVREVNRLLVPGALFKFQAQGHPSVEVNPEETWVGVPISQKRAEDLAARAGFEARYSAGAGQEEFWLWFFKNPNPQP